jgi:hypothetical protein
MEHKMLATLVEEAPIWELRNGFFYVSDERSGLCRAYTPHIFFQTFARMAEVAREYNFSGAEVIPFPAPAVGVTAKH